VPRVFQPVAVVDGRPYHLSIQLSASAFGRRSAFIHSSTTRCILFWLKPWRLLPPREVPTRPQCFFGARTSISRPTLPRP